MVARRVEAQGPGIGLGVDGLWLSGVPLDTLGLFAGELGRVPGTAGASCAPAGAERDAAREEALRVLADAFAPRPVSAAPRPGTSADDFLKSIGRSNLVLQLKVDGKAPALARTLAAAGRPVHFAGIHSPSRFASLLEGWLAGLSDRVAVGGSLEGAAALFELRADRIDRTMDAILLQRMDSAPNDSIRAAYRVILGRVGRSAAAVCRRRLSTEANGARLKGLVMKLAPLPVLLVTTAPERLADCAAPGVLLGVPYAAAVDAPCRPEGRALDEGYDDGKRLLDKLANYQLDLDRIAAELEEQP